MKVVGQLKDGTRFTHDDVIRIDDYEGVIIVHHRDGIPRSMRRAEIEWISVDFLLPKPETISDRKVITQKRQLIGLRQAIKPLCGLFSASSSHCVPLDW